MKQTRFEAMQIEVARHFEKEQGERITCAMKAEYDQLCQKFEIQKDPMEKHKRNNIYPVVTAFHALIEEGMTRDEAAAFSNDCFLVLMEEPKKMIQKMMKIPGAYHLMPTLWKKLMPKLFSPASGFVFNIHPTGKDRVRFDMEACPYLQACRELDCMELAPTFCATDDLCYGNMHPKLIWNRTKTLARGGNLCDFDLYIKK